MCIYNKTNLSKIYDNLKKYSFKEKMTLCQQCSTKLMEYDHLEIKGNIKDCPLPWELEAFAQLAILAEEDEIIKSFNDDDYFASVISQIRNFVHPYLAKQKNNINFKDSFVMVAALSQFKEQENILNRLYRYDFFWSYQDDELDMNQEFKNKYSGLTYNHFIELACLIYFYAHRNLAEESIIAYHKAYSYITLTHYNAIKLLTIKRADYIRMQNEKNKNDIRNCVYGFNYLFPYPFLEYKDLIYLPLPYLIVDAVSESLLTRATNEDKKLRELIGLKVAQSYIEFILKESNIYDDVLPETQYVLGKNKINSPDVMIRENDLFCFIDTKLSSPKISLRQFEETDQDIMIKQYAKNIVQLYKRIQDFLNKEYYPFSSEVEIKKNQCFGIVLQFENSFIPMEKVYKEACCQLNITFDSSEGKYIQSNIKLTDFRDIEQFALSSYSIFPALINNRDTEKMWAALGLFSNELYSNVSPKIIPSLTSFQDKIQLILKNSVMDLKKLGVVK